ncbi:APC family permease [uncultured Pseudoramibacter sp.]|uniref:APC family permease n=1 Tax=uncultured Pseudoramibacter sp. TaxID=1623493 RepID=UPI0025F82413|nr:APC family permease [uncultured Pseudoramibacter sp.]
MNETKKLGLGSVVSVSVGLVIATSCLVSLGQGAGTIGVTFIIAMVVALALNLTTIASLSELNALMPNTTGGLAQYTMAGLGPFPTLISMVGGYLICNVLSCGVEASIFSYAMAQTFSFIPIPSIAWSLIMTVLIMIVNLYGVDMFAKIQDLVSYLLIGSMAILGIICVVQSIMVLGFHNYIPWKELLSSPAPHLLYGERLLGNVGKIWMTLVGALAVVSTQNSTANGLSRICQGMAGMNMLPQIFAKTNKYDVPWFGVVIISAAIGFFAWMSDSSSDGISFFILVGSVFWMVSYILAHIDVLVLRRRLPKAPRSFKVPGGPILPLIGIAGTVFMILNISTDPAERNMIWLVTGVTLLALAVYAVFWIKYKMRRPVFKHVPLNEVMAMENKMYGKIRRARGVWK